MDFTHQAKCFGVRCCYIVTMAIGYRADWRVSHVDGKYFLLRAIYFSFHNNFKLNLLKTNGHENMFYVYFVAERKRMRCLALVRSMVC